MTSRGRHSLRAAASRVRRPNAAPLLESRLASPVRLSVFRALSLTWTHSGKTGSWEGRGRGASAELGGQPCTALSGKFQSGVFDRGAFEKPSVLVPSLAGWSTSMVTAYNGEELCL